MANILIWIFKRLGWDTGQFDPFIGNITASSQYDGLEGDLSSKKKNDAKSRN